MLSAFVEISSISSASLSRSMITSPESPFPEKSPLESDVLIVGICMDKDPNALGAYIKKTPLNFTIVNNTKPIAQQFTDIFAVPTHFIINTKTGVTTKTMGLISLSDLKEYSQRSQ